MIRSTRHRLDFRFGTFMEKVERMGRQSTPCPHPDHKSGGNVGDERECQVDDLADGERGGDGSAMRSSLVWVCGDCTTECDGRED